MQTVPDSFHISAQNGIRPHTWGFWASFPKNIDDTVEFAIWDVSEWDAGDLWAPSDDNPIAYWDYYDYLNYSDRLVSMEWTRQMDFPYSVQSALCDISLNNYDNFFTPGSGSPIDGYILPKRPFRLYSGFRNSSTIQQMVGITQGMPVLDTKEKIADFHGLDFLSEMFSMPLNTLVAMHNVRTDEVLSEIFQQFGITPSQYNLAQGRNKIPFVFFQKGSNAGEAFRMLMQAEGGMLWIDEQGVIRFDQRLLPLQDPVMLFNDSNVEDISTTGDSEIINTVRIRSVIRDVQGFQPIYTKAASTGTSNLFVIPPNSTKEMEASLQDPCLSVVTPTLGISSNVSWFTARDSLDNPVNSDVSVISDELRQNTYVMTFENNNAFAVEINAIEVWGEPAKEVDVIEYEAYDTDSVAAYGEQVLEIDNNMFGSESNCESFALTIIDAYKDFSSVIQMSVKGDPSLQLGDIIDVDTRDFRGIYKVIKISNSYRDSRAEQTITARIYNQRSWAFWDVSVWDGTEDVWAP